VTEQVKLLTFAC